MPLPVGVSVGVTEGVAASGRDGGAEEGVAVVVWEWRGGRMAGRTGSALRSKRARNAGSMLILALLAFEIARSSLAREDPE